MKAILWFRNDLRLHDNQLFQNLESYDEILPVYIIDDRWSETTEFGFSKAGPFRFKFLLESLEELKRKLKAVGSDLLVKTGNPGLQVSVVAKEIQADAICFQKEHTWEELKDEADLATIFDGQIVSHEGLTLIHPNDEQFGQANIPNVFTEFRKRNEKYGQLRDPLETISRLPNMPNINVNELQSLKQLDIKMPNIDNRAAISFKGGETAALNRLQYYFWSTEKLANYKYTRNGLLGPDYSSKFSAWLANGCISPRYIYSEVKRFERNIKKNSSTYWLIFELYWRDFFRFQAMKNGRRLFYKKGMLNRNMKYNNSAENFQKWMKGETGQSFVDANMKELKLTGFMSNRGRQNVASYLCNELSVDWRWGAAWFEHCLVDYDVTSNYGNWQYVAGVGHNPRKDRWFNPNLQTEKYDPQGKYQSLWLHEDEQLGLFDS